MSRFVLTAQIQLQAPTNTRQVVSQIRSELAGRPVSIPVEVKGAAQTQNAINSITRETERATGAAQALGRSFGLAVKRFAAFTVASRAVSLFTNSLASAVDEAIDFQREIVKIAQVLGQPVKNLGKLQETITDLSTGLGVVSKDLLAVTRILSQAGVRGASLEVALQSLAKSTLAPTFDDITQTAEGAVAILSQFEQGVGSLEAQLGSINAVAGAFAVESGDLIGAVRRFGGVFKSAGGSLEELLAVFTSVRQTTRESGESIATGLRTIFTRIQRPATIQYLRELGVELTDLDGKFIGPYEATIALGKAFSELPQGDTRFVAIAEELGGFRQIGKVIPLIQQYEVASEALKVAQKGQGSLAEDAATAQQALAVQITKVKEEFLALVRGIAESSSFQIFTRSALELASALIKIADSVKPLIPLLTTLAAIKFTQGLSGFFQGIGASVRGAGSVQTRNSGGKILKFARGGYVPGTGNSDTVPAMLQPGEFVIKKSSAKKLGPDTLRAMNENRFSGGGLVNVRAKNAEAFGAFSILDEGVIARKGRTISSAAAKILRPKVDNLIANSDPKDLQGIEIPEIELGEEELYTSGSNTPKGDLKKYIRTNKKIGRDGSERIRQFGLFDQDQRKEIEEEYKETRRKEIIAQRTSQLGKLKGLVGKKKGADYSISLQGPFNVKKIGGPIDRVEGKFSDLIGEASESALLAGVNKVKESELVRGLDILPIDTDESKLFNYSDFLEGARESVEGFLLEGIVGALTNSKVGGGGTNFDFPELGSNPNSPQKERLKRLFADDDSFISKLEAADAKRQKSTADSGNGALFNKIAKDERLEIVLANSGGSIGGSGSGDTVPALLTPGEFVVNKDSAQKIGYSNLEAMNKRGVSKFAKGGPVGIQKFNNGGKAKAGGLDKLLNADSITAFSVAVPVVTAAFSSLRQESDKLTDAQAKQQNFIDSASQGLTQLAVISFGALKLISVIKDWESAVSKGKEEVVRNAQAYSEASAQLEGSGFGGSSAERQDQSSIESILQTAQTDQTAQAVQQKSDSSLFGTGADIKKLQTATDELAKSEQELEAARAGQSSMTVEEIKGNRELSKTTLKKRDIEEQLRKGLIKSVHSGEDLEKQRSNLMTREKELQQKLLVIEEDASKKKVQRVQVASEALLRAQDKQAAASKRVNSVYLRSVSAVKGVGQAYARTTSDMVKASGATNVFSKNLVRFRATFKSTGAAASQAKREWDKLSASVKKGFQPGGRLRSGAASVAKGGAVAGVALGAVSTFASSIDSYLQKEGERAEGKARDQGNVSGSAKIAESRVLSGGVAEAFSLGGMIEIFRNGIGSFADRIKEQAKKAGAQSAGETAVQKISGINKEIGAEDGKFRDVSGELKAGKATSELAQTAGEAREKISKLDPNDKDRVQLEGALNNVLREGLSAMVAQNVGLEQAEASARKLAGGNEKLESQFLSLVRSSINLREAQKELARANFDSLKITSAFGAANSAVEAFTIGLSTGASELDSYIIQLESSRKNIGVDASASIDAIEKSLISSANGGPGGTDLQKAIGVQANAARGTSGFAQNIGGAVSDLEVSRSDSPLSANQIKSRLEEAIPDNATSEIKNQIRRLIDKNIGEINPDSIATTDISELISKISSDAQQLSAGFFESAKLQSEHNDKMSALYEQREKLEQLAAEAFNKAIDIQLEAAKEFESFGGGKLTSDQQLSARIAQFNNVGGAAGVDLRTGGAGDIRRVASELAGVFNSQQQGFLQNITERSVNANVPSAFSGPRGVEDQREEARRANESLINFTKQRIGLLKEELSIVQTKNREEKNALDKLIGGDIEGFIKGQAAAGAGAALRTGSSGLTSLFSASALGAGFKGLQGQGLSDRQLRRAEDLTLGAVGIEGNGVLSGTTAEEQALKGSGRELASTLGDLAGQSAQFEASEIAIKEATITATNLVFKSELGNVARRNSTRENPLSSTGLARGGIVYANRGMFVPRGTDTVPAMLTPGEFVVNRSAVQRGNNLQILKAMNTQSVRSGPNHMSGGGRVYYNTGGIAEGGGGGNMFADALPALRNVFSDFSAAVDRLVNTQFSVKLDTTNVNVNFNGGSFLASMKDDIKRELLDEVSREIRKAKPNSNGDMELRKTVL